ncbi:conserved repeat domain-containing protein [Halomicrobium zhouii]|uniref:Conserved repeat domain-containing protein n=1 Tax=Halomicrobium zhouii TaxID=767519 RepID=A0A1I6KN00_9EURY|nr:DUF58 domain-containing protein [Halomicrobium zhouii]SFR92544.1 conserved repeat domain-containing protein [Halomicrobium zhouii]
MNRSGLLAVAGVLAFGLGLATLAVPGLVALGAEGAVLVVVGVLALVQLVRVARARYRGQNRRAGTADPELSADVESPGADLGAVLDAFDADGYRYAQGGRRRSQLRRVAVEALTRSDDCSEAEARERIATGTWTDDPVAAAFLADDDGDDVPRLSQLGSRLRSHLRSRLTAESAYQRRIRRTIDAIAAVAGISSGPAATTDSAAESRSRLAGLRRRLTGDVGTDDVETGDVETGDPPSAWGDVGESRRRSTGHWRGVSAVALAGIAVGVLAEQATALLVGVVGISYAAYARSTTAPSPTLSVERTLSVETPSPGESVTVTVSVTNDGDRALPDLRLVDGVPPALSVVDGSPRLGTALRAGETASYEYAVEASRGNHAFEPVHVVARNLAGTAERERTVSPGGTTTIRCVPPLEPVETAVPVRRQPTGLTGRAKTDVGGEGTEFFATRPYRPGDPLHRIDWNRRAKSGDLATLELREERSVTVVLVVDASDGAAVGPEPRGSTAIDRSVDGARRAFSALLDDGNRVGVAALADDDCWIPPGAGEVHRTRVRELLATDPAFTPGGRPPSPSFYAWFSRLRSRLPGDAQVVLFSPLCSDAAVLAATRLEAHGYPVTVVSPDPTSRRTTGNRLAAVVRRFRTADLRSGGVPVVDWDWEDPLAVALARSTRRWSR